ncbi:MAG: hypothetical protein GTO05_06915 [Gemmatimonadales bacterium]|nr:hypothetical protein [Gemmatimonadales bacterium]
MAESRRSEFVKRLSTVGVGPRESIHVLLGGIVYDIREQAIKKRFSEEEMEAVIEFHDEAEDLWRDTMVSDPPLDPHEIVARLQKLLNACTGPLGQYEARLEHGLRSAERFERKREEG